MNSIFMIQIAVLIVTLILGSIGFMLVSKALKDIDGLGKISQPMKEEGKVIISI